MAQTRVRVRGARELAAKTDRMAAHLTDVSGARTSFESIFRARMERRFAAGGEGDWGGHAPATIERWGSHPPLRLTGALQRAMTSGRVVIAADRTSITYEPEAPFYGAIVDRRRPIRPEDVQLVDDVRDVFAKHVVEEGGR